MTPRPLARSLRAARVDGVIRRFADALCIVSACRKNLVARSVTDRSLIDFTVSTSIMATATGLAEALSSEEESFHRLG